MALNFADVATQKVEDIEKAPLPPIGVYRFKVTKLPETKTSANEEWDILNFLVRAQEAVDVEDIADYKGEISGIMNRVSFMFNRNDEVAFAKTLDRLRTFLEKHLKVADSGMSVKEALNASVGAEFLGTIGWRADKQNEGDYQADITRTAPLD